MKKSHLLGAVLVLLGWIFCFPTTVLSASVSNVLIFGGSNCNGGNVCGDNSLIDQSYGDIVGKLNVIWDRNIATIQKEQFLHWTTGFVGTSNVGYSDAASFAEILFIPEPGYRVTLNSFDWTPFPGLRNVAVAVSDETGLRYGNGSTSSGLLRTYGNTGAGELYFDPITSSSFISLQFDPASIGGFGNVGLDNISYTVSAVPLPAAAWLFPQR